MAETKRVIALGFFDGVHLGHAALMQMTKRRAQERGVTPAVLTFDTHPDTLVKGVEVPLINSPEGARRSSAAYTASRASFSSTLTVR